jgi:hypothetical protein
MERAIEILEAEKAKLSKEYDKITYELHLARQFGKKNELPPLRHLEAENWVRLETTMELIKKLEAERVEA